MIPKFRAWDKFDKEMLNVHGINYDAEGVWTKEMIDDESDGGFIYFSDIELLQSTGLFDKNGKEIFEGDLILTENGVEEVTFTTQNNCYGVYLQYEKMFNTPIDYYATRISLDHIKGEIIGNKFEHPHLLGEG
ncbi:YopX family protein [Mammaliicoccus sciuri]|uniref:YopX family protein n=1 Tax=Mammaliicoccus sciuri TaxID=1296 RepID=UPI002883E73C|nr:YopX family protein [Mammaliicoccus sciuri]MDT0702001.1 YopX family protein [Mammaliicoccus sciuri]